MFDGQKYLIKKVIKKSADNTIPKRKPNLGAG